MRILIIADFQEDTTRFLTNNSRKFAKGFTRNGHDVLQFSYRNTLQRLSPINSKQWARILAKKKVDKLLTTLARDHQSEIVFITAFKLLDAKTVAAVKSALPKATIVSWYGDMCSGVDPKIAPTARLSDWFFATSGLATLQKYKEIGVKKCAFMPNPCDPDTEHRLEAPKKWETDLLFTGKLAHSQEGQDPLREQLIRKLAQDHKLTTHGCLGNRAIYGLDYLQAISAAKIAISINAFNNVDLYHSDRIIQYLACGTCVLAANVPDSNLLFEDKKHLCYFNSEKQCLQLIEKLLSDNQAREEIAEAGMAHAHEKFNCQILAQHIIDIATTGKLQQPWTKIIANIS